MLGGSRGVSSVISTVLLVAVAVVLAATISTFALLFAEDVEQPAPAIGQSSGEFVGGTADGDQIVRITHLAGDTVPVSEIEIVVDAPQCDVSEARIVDLPVKDLYLGFSQNIAYGEDLIDTSPTGFQPETEFGVLDAENPDEFEAGSFFEFRINSKEANCGPGGSGFADGDTVTVEVVHTPTNTIIIEEALTASRG